MTETPIGPAYYVQHPDGSYSEADPKPRGDKELTAAYAGAEYIALKAELLLDAIDALSGAEQRLEESDDENDDAVHDARDDVWAATRSLRSGIYEFRKRRDALRKVYVAETGENPWE